jgi:hypothetical protein
VDNNSTLATRRHSIGFNLGLKSFARIANNSALLRCVEARPSIYKPNTPPNSSHIVTLVTRSRQTAFQHYAVVAEPQFVTADFGLFLYSCRRKDRDLNLLQRPCNREILTRTKKIVIAFSVEPQDVC